MLPQGQLKCIDRRLKRFGYKTYIAYRVSPRWAGKRKQIFGRSKGGCEVCGEGADVVHHRTYEAICREPLKHLVALCNDCHDGTHRLVDKGLPLWTAHLVYGDKITVEEQREVIAGQYRKDKAERERKAHRKAMRKQTKRKPIGKHGRGIGQLNDDLHRLQVEAKARRERNAQLRAA